MDRQYQWDEISCEIMEVDWRLCDDGWELTEEGHDQPYDVWRSDRGHLSLTCTAPTAKVAHDIFCMHPEYEE